MEDKILNEIYASGEELRKQFISLDPKWEKGEGPISKQYWWMKADNKLIGFVDLNGKELYPPKFKKVFVNSNTFKTLGVILNAVSEDGKTWGVLDVMNGKMMIPCIYPKPVWFIGEYAEITPNVFLDMNGRRVKDLNKIIDYQNHRNQMIMNAKKSLFGWGMKQEDTLVDNLDQIPHKEYDKPAEAADIGTSVYDEGTPESLKPVEDEVKSDTILTTPEPTITNAVTTDKEPEIANSELPKVEPESIKPVETPETPKEQPTNNKVVALPEPDPYTPQKQETGVISTTPFNVSDANSSYIEKILKMYAEQYGDKYEDVKRKYDAQVKAKQEIYSKVSFMKQMSDNAPEEVLFNYYVQKLNIPVDENGKDIFFNDIKCKQVFDGIKAANYEKISISPYFYKSGKEATFILLPTTNKKFEYLNSCDTACCTADLKLAFNRDFVRRINFFAYVKGLKPRKGDFYKSLNEFGFTEDYWCYFEFLVMHEIYHFKMGDHFLNGKLYPNHNILNIVSDFFNNTQLIKRGLPQLPLGMFSDEISFRNPKIKSTKDAYNYVQEELKKLSPEDLAEFNKAVKEAQNDKHVDEGAGGGEGGPSVKDIVKNLDAKYSVGRVLFETSINQYVVVSEVIPVDKEKGIWRYKVVSLEDCGSDLVALKDRILKQVIEVINGQRKITEAFETMGVEILNGKALNDGKMKSGFNLGVIIKDVVTFLNSVLDKGGRSFVSDEEDLTSRMFQLPNPNQQQGGQNGSDQQQQEQPEDEEQPDYIPPPQGGGSDQQQGSGSGDEEEKQKDQQGSGGEGQGEEQEEKKQSGEGEQSNQQDQQGQEGQQSQQGQEGQQSQQGQQGQSSSTPEQQKSGGSLEDIKQKIQDYQEKQKQAVKDAEKEQQKSGEKSEEQKPEKGSEEGGLTAEEIGELEKKIRKTEEELRNKDDQEVETINRLKDEKEKGIESEEERRRKELEDMATEAPSSGTIQVSGSPRIRWELLLRKMIPTNFIKVDTFSKINPKTASKMPQVVLTGTASIDPGEEDERGSKVGLVIVVDESGSMSDALGQAMGEINKLLKQNMKFIRDLWFVRFSDKFEMFHMEGKTYSSALKFEAFKGTDFTGFKKTISVTNDGSTFCKGGAKFNLQQMLTAAWSGGTRFNDTMLSVLKAFNEAHYNILLFTDSDIVWDGDNIQNTLKLINHCKMGRKNSLGVFLARPEDFKNWLKKTRYPHGVSVILPKD